MDQLKQIIMSRLVFMSTFKKRKQLLPQNPQINEQMLHDLLLQKKKLHIQQSSESKIAYSIIKQKIEAPYRLMQMQFYEMSKLIMKIYDPGFCSESDKEEIVKFVGKGLKKQRIVDVTHEKKQRKQGQSQTGIQKLTIQKKQQQQEFKAQKHLGTNIQDKKKLVLKIVRLYYEFFLDKKSSNKSQQIMHMYKKKLCEEGIIVPTLFCWMHDWISKEFSGFVRQQISELSMKSRGGQSASKLKPRYKYSLPSTISDNNQSIISQQASPISITQRKERYLELQSSPKRMTKDRQLQNPSRLDVYFSLDLSHQQSKQDLYKKISLIKKKNLEIREQEINVEVMSRKNLKRRKDVFLTIEGGRDVSKEKYDRSDKDVLRDNNNKNNMFTSNLLPFKQQQEVKSYNSIPIPQQTTPINRQILIGAYYEKYFNLYRSLEHVLPDLDINYVKQIKRNDRKQQVKKRIKQISRILVRTQPLIKITVDEYEVGYYERKKREKKEINRKRQKLMKLNKLNQIFNDDQPTYSQENNISSRQVDFKLGSGESMVPNLLQKRFSGSEQTSQTKKSYRKRRSKIHKVQSQKNQQSLKLNNPIQLQFNLPQIPQKSKSHHSKEQSKIVLIQSGRYRLLDKVIDSETLAQMTGNSKKKKKSSIRLSNNSIDLGEMGLMGSGRRQSASGKKGGGFGEGKGGILELIMKNKGKAKDNEKESAAIQKDTTYASNEAQLLSNSITIDTQQHAFTTNKRSIVSKRHNRYPPKLNPQPDPQTFQKHYNQIIQNMQLNDYELISAWERGQETPYIG